MGKKVVSSLKEECLRLITHTGINNLLNTERLEKCDDENSLHTLYNLLKSYNTIVQEIRNKPYYLWCRERNALIKKLEGAGSIRDKIREVVYHL